MPARAPAYLPALTPAIFRSRLLTILGDCRLLWMPQPNDTTVVRSFETWPGRVGTPDGDVSARISRLGHGVQQSFSSAGTQFISFPDTDNLSFGNGTTDQAFSVVALVNVTDTAAARAILSKWVAATVNREWLWTIDAVDTMSLILRDESAGVNCARVSDAVVTQASWRLFGATYDGTGGATAANGMTLYQDGAAIASTATNNAAYVAMEPLAGVCEVGAINAHTASLYDGSAALVAVCQKNMSASDHASAATLMRRFYGVP